MAKRSIPNRVKTQVAKIIERFNQEVGSEFEVKYVPRYWENYLYLGRIDFMGNQHRICRLTYTGDLNSWKLAIYNYNDNRYHSYEWINSGLGQLDGTVEGAMEVGLEAYPP